MTSPEASAKAILGRERELAEIRAALGRAVDGDGGLFVVSGEAGIGKTTLARQVDQEARTRGFVTVWGRAWQAGGAPAFWPFIQAFEQHPRLAKLLQSGPSGSVPEVDPDRARFELFSAVRSLVAELALRRPLLLVIDDLHSTDQASLLLFHFLARNLRQSRVLLLGTFREIEAHLVPALGSLIAQIAREGRSLPIGRLEQEDAASMIRRAAPDLGGELESVLMRASHGNPLFLDEMIRLCLADRAAFSVANAPLPTGVREVIRQRLSYLPIAARVALDAAAVIGDEFDLALLGEVTAMTELELDDFVERATIAGVLGTDSDRRFRFEHAMFRESLYRDLPPSRRRTLHSRVAGALQKRHAGDTRAPWAEMAHHGLGGLPDDIERTVSHALSASADAMHHLAYGDAIALLERTRGALRTLPSQPTLCGELSLAQGMARIRIGEITEGQDLCLEAATIARESSTPSLLARAALGYGSEFIVAFVDPVLVGLLRESAAALGSEDSSLRARVLARLAAALQPARGAEDSINLARDAIGMARRLADEATLLEVLYAAASAMMDFIDPRERLLINTEVVALAGRHGDRAKQLRSHARLVFDHLEIGDFEAVLANANAYEEAARALELPHHLWRAPLFRAIIALALGRFDEAEALRDRARKLAGDPRAADVERALVAHESGVQRATEQLDDLDALEAQTRALYAGLPDVATFVAAMTAMLASRAEDKDRAACYLAQVPRDSWIWFGDPSALSTVAESVAFVGDGKDCAMLYDRLAAASGRDVSWGMFGFLWEGPIDRLLALLAASIGRWPLAGQHFEAAIARLEQLGARPYLCRTRYEYARALQARGDENDRSRMASLLESAAADAKSLALHTLSRLIASRKAAAPSTSPAAPSFRLYREGDYWSLLSDGNTARLKDSRGLRMLARLIAEPEREIHARDLQTPQAASTAGTSADAADSGEMLDEHARAAYRARVQELRSEIEQATQFADLARAARLREELEFVTAEIARAVGLGGRSRRAGSANERARIAVQRRIRDAIDRIAAVAPAAGQHLRDSVLTGAFCSYRPGASRRRR